MNSWDRDLLLHMEHSPLGVVGWDRDLLITYWSGQAQRIFGWSAEEALGRRIDSFPLIYGEDLGRVGEVIAQLVSGRHVHVKSTNRNLTKDARVIWCEWYNSVLRDQEGRLASVLSLILDVTELKEAERALAEERRRAEQERQLLLEAERAARGEAERHSRLKDEFVATLSHELRTPLNAILGWARLLRTQMARPEEVAQGLDVIERNARVQAQIINDLLDVSRLQAGKIHLEFQPLEPAPIVEAAVASVREAAERKGVDLMCEIQAGVGRVSGDSVRLQQVLWNLLANAIKFTPQGGQVRVALTQTGDAAEIRVTDTGQGIRPDFLPHVFDRFRQADSSTMRRHGGLGLGLAIVKQLCDLHNAAVSVHSDGEGLGATFTVRLPLLRRAVTGESAPAPAQPLSLRGIRVLLVEDEDDARELTQRILEECEAEVRAVESAAEALRALGGFRPHVLVSDISMPGEDGYALIQKVRQRPAGEGGAVPAVALTAFARAEDRSRAFAAGYQAHVPKPVDMVDLLTAVARLAQPVRRAAGPS